ncbi:MULTISPECIES: hypothetical protein [Nocardioides]|uniref:hypothetical protein n=1 Tax=Nocardioides TaxID=1839 RepID=UPI0018DB322C|nr:MULTISPECIES: hypothetical protein [Nocardioides]
MSDHHPATSADAVKGLRHEEPAVGEQPPHRGVLAAAWSAVTALVGGIMGLLPHLLHHVGLLGGAVLVTGVTGNVAFAVLGLVFSLPLLRRLYRRFGTWKAPALALAVFALMFSLSALVIGPAISDADPQPAPVPTEQVDPDHDEHHD